MRVLSRTEYNTIHQWNLRNWAKAGKCEHCRRGVKTQWANKDDRYIRFYKANWLELCIDCHSEYDTKRRGTVKKVYYTPIVIRKLRASVYNYFVHEHKRLMTYAWYRQLR